MKPTVLVTGSGGPAGVAVLLELKRLGVATVAADCDPTAVGFSLADTSAVLKRADDPEFASHLVAIALAHDAVELIVTVAEELAVLTDPHSRGALSAAGIAAWLPTAEALARCTDKWAFAKSCIDAGVASPETALGGAEGIDGPWIVKPRFGRGSQNVFKTDNPDDLPTLLRLVPEPIVQAALSGLEFSADCLVDDYGQVRGMAARWRSEVRGGISTKGTTFDPTLVEDVVRAAVAATGITTCVNVQGFLDSERGASVIEINPRFSGALPLSLAAGADLVGQHLRRLEGLDFQDDRLIGRPGVTMARYFESTFTQEVRPVGGAAPVSPLRQTGLLDP